MTFLEPLDKLAPSMALALRAAVGVRVCNPENAVRLRGNDEQKPSSATYLLKYQYVPKDSLKFSNTVELEAYEAIDENEAREGMRAHQLGGNGGVLGLELGRLVHPQIVT